MLNKTQLNYLPGTSLSDIWKLTISFMFDAWLKFHVIQFLLWVWVDFSWCDLIEHIEIEQKLI